MSAALITGELRTAVAATRDLLTVARSDVAQGWESLAAALGAGAMAATNQLGDVLAVGPVDHVLDVAGALASGELGFVTVAERRVRPWQRENSRAHDPTLRLWQAGWSVVRVERIDVAVDDAALVYAVGIARRTPTVAVSIEA